jgi:hypothetical protein
MANQQILNIKKNGNDQLFKWKSPLLLAILSLFLFESISGFILFFFGQFISNTSLLGPVHWILGIVTLIPYAIYQWRHYFSVRQYSSQFHYKLGLYTFFTTCLVVISGFPLIFYADHSQLLYTIVDLVHVVSSFAFLILLSGHLVLVVRITMSRLNKKVPDETGTFSAVIGRKILWIPLVISILTLLLITLLT